MSTAIESKIIEYGVIAKDTTSIQLFEKAPVLAQTNATIMITGESGTGKDFYAKFLHNLSPRSSKPFIHLNCASLTDSLFESELFGYEPGTFSGSLKDGQQGLIEAANNGTLFLDEVGELSASSQVKLLDFLQTKMSARLGGGKKKKYNVKVISATNRDLLSEVLNKTFRDDLYYRLSVVNVKIPPLRERPNDVEAFSKAMLKKHFPDKTLSSDGIEYLKTLTWPGNLRELYNLINRIGLLSDSVIIDKASIETFCCKRAFEIQHTPETDIILETNLKYAMNKFEQEHLSKILSQSKTISEAAKKLGISQSSLSKKKKKYSL